jgi:hypothetical protein
MGLILEIRQKSRIIIEPELDVSPEDYHKLKVGECTIAKDEKENKSYLLRLTSSKIGNDFEKEDLIIQRLRLNGEPC